MNECDIGIFGITEVKLCDDRTLRVLKIMFYRYQRGRYELKMIYTEERKIYATL